MEMGNKIPSPKLFKKKLDYKKKFTYTYNITLKKKAKNYE